MMVRPDRNATGDVMTTMDDLLALERAGWDALSTGSEAAASFYDEVLAKQVLMVLPGGMVLDDRDQVIESMRGAPWDGYDLSEEQVHELAADCAVVVYRASARRGDNEYRAVFNSTYVREDGAWRMALHQQTP
jgi:hypothetical protein